MENCFGNDAQLVSVVAKHWRKDWRCDGALLGDEQRPGEEGDVVLFTFITEPSVYVEDQRVGRSGRGQDKARLWDLLGICCGAHGASLSYPNFQSAVVRTQSTDIVVLYLSRNSSIGGREGGIF